MLHKLMIRLDGGSGQIEGSAALQQCFDNNEKLVSHVVVQAYNIPDEIWDCAYEIYLFDDGR